MTLTFRTRPASWQPDVVPPRGLPKARVRSGEAELGDDVELGLEGLSPLEIACIASEALTARERSRSGPEIRLAESVFAFPPAPITSSRTLTVSLMKVQSMLPDRSSVRLKGLKIG